MLEKIYVVLIILSLLIAYICWTRSVLNVGAYLLSIYLFSFVGALFLPDNGAIFTFEAGSYLLLLLFFFVTPSLAIDSGRVWGVRLIDSTLFRCMAFVLIVSGWFSILYFLPVVFRLFLSGESFVILRTDMVGGETYVDASIYYYLASFASQFYPVTITLYFYSILFTNNGRAFNNLLLLSSTAYIFNVLAAVGRDGVVLWSMSFLFAFFLFKNFFTERHLKHFRRIAFLACALFLAVFVPITISRFSILGGAEAVFLSLLSYSSQQLMYFNEIYNSGFTFPYEPSRIFPLIGYALGFDQEGGDFLEYNRAFYEAYGIDINVFKTFVGDFYVYLGSSVTFWVGLFFCISSLIILRNNGIVTLEKLIFATLLCQVPLHGVFYYKLGYNVSNLYFLAVVTIAVLISFSRLFSNRYIG